jgi:hypothetical protein
MIKNIYILFIFIFLQSCSTKPKNFNFYGNTEYQQSNTKNLNTELNLEYKLPVYETKNKKILYHFGGKLSSDYDHFGNQIKETNTFTTFGIDF